MDKIKIRKGLDIHLEGEAKKQIERFEPSLCAVKPTDFIGIVPKMLVSEGDCLQVGSVLFHDKNNERIVFTSPVSGKVKEIVRGEKRAILEVVIESDGKNESIDFGALVETHHGTSLQLSRNKLIDKMLRSGIWPMIRQRPFATIANPNDVPKHIFISMFDTAPLAPDYGFIIENQNDALAEGINVLSKLTDGNVYINVIANSQCRDARPCVSTDAKNVIVTEFSGPHPTGNIGTQINAISPINKGETVWYCNPQDVITIGNLFLTGKYDSSRIIALTGSAVTNPHYYQTRTGADITPICNDIDSNVRIISGNVLTGTNITNDKFLCFHDSQVTIIPEGNNYRLFGWLRPVFKRYTDTNTNGDTRPYIMTGQFEKVFPFDIYPMQLIKACLVKDIDQMEELGIYEVDAEDFALCEVIDPSKTPIQQIIREGLEFIRKETC